MKIVEEIAPDGRRSFKVEHREDVVPTTEMYFVEVGATASKNKLDQELHELGRAYECTLLDMSALNEVADLARKRIEDYQGTTRKPKVSLWWSRRDLIFLTLCETVSLRAKRVRRVLHTANTSEAIK